MYTVKLLVRIGDFDAEIMLPETDALSTIADQINLMVATAPEIKPRPRYQANNKLPDMPFVGTIDHTELMPAKDGKKEYCLAHVKHEDGSIIPVRYFPPLKTWKAGEKVKVQKGQYGAELKELDDNEPPF
jgi:hypothetical protein